MSQVAPSKDQPVLVLASASARRLALLQQIGLEPEVRPTRVIESAQAGESPTALVERLAREKCLAAEAQCGDRTEVILAADTIIDRDGEVLGKPDDEHDAVLMLLSLAGRRHRVLSGVSICNTVSGYRQTLVAATEVTFTAFDRALAQRYAASGEPLGKAGAYAIQGRGARFVARIDGNYSTVMGLPLFETVSLLESAGMSLP